MTISLNRLVHVILDKRSLELSKITLARLMLSPLLLSTERARAHLTGLYPSQ